MFKECHIGKTKTSVFKAQFHGNRKVSCMRRSPPPPPPPRPRPHPRPCPRPPSWLPDDALPPFPTPIASVPPTTPPSPASLKMAFAPPTKTCHRVAAFWAAPPSPAASPPPLPSLPLYRRSFSPASREVVPVCCRGPFTPVLFLAQRFLCSVPFVTSPTRPLQRSTSNRGGG